MKFLCLGFFNPSAFESAPESVTSPLMESCMEQCKPFRATGKVRMEESLGTPSKARSIRTRRGQTLVTDGPFLETKEQIGSFFIVEAASMEEAVEIARQHPAAMMGEEFGFGIEVRAIEEI